MCATAHGSTLRWRPRDERPPFGPGGSGDGGQTARSVALGTAAGGRMSPGQDRTGRRWRQWLQAGHSSGPSRQPAAWSKHGTASQSRKARNAMDPSPQHPQQVRQCRRNHNRNRNRNRNRNCSRNHSSTSPSTCSRCSTAPTTAHVPTMAQWPSVERGGAGGALAASPPSRAALAFAWRGGARRGRCAARRGETRRGARRLLRHGAAAVLAVAEPHLCTAFAAQQRRVESRAAAPAAEECLRRRRSQVGLPMSLPRRAGHKAQPLQQPSPVARPSVAPPSLSLPQLQSQTR